MFGLKANVKIMTGGTVLDLRGKSSIRLLTNFFAGLAGIPKVVGFSSLPDFLRYRIFRLILHNFCRILICIVVMSKYVLYEFDLS